MKIKRRDFMNIKPFYIKIKPLKEQEMIKIIPFQKSNLTKSYL